VYEGFFIPKGANDYYTTNFHVRSLTHVWLGAWVIGNIWYDVFTQSFVVIMIHIVFRAILHDPDVYPEPEVFNPDRFLTPDGTLRDDSTLPSVFGFGKRICPGKYLVDATLFIFSVTVLSVLRIEKRRDSGDGPFEYTYSGGLVRCGSMFSLEVERVNWHVLIKPSKRVPMLYHCKGQNCRRAYFGRRHCESLNH